MQRVTTQYGHTLQPHQPHQHPGLPDASSSTNNVTPLPSGTAGLDDMQPLKSKWDGFAVLTLRQLETKGTAGECQCCKDQEKKLGEKINNT